MSSKKPADEKYVAVLIKFDPADLARLDKLREKIAPLTPRSTFLRSLMFIGEARAKKGGRLPSPK